MMRPDEQKAHMIVLEKCKIKYEGFDGTLKISTSKHSDWKVLFTWIVVNKGRTSVDFKIRRFEQAFLDVLNYKIVRGTRINALDVEQISTYIDASAESDITVTIEVVVIFGDAGTAKTVIEKYENFWCTS